MLFFFLLMMVDGEVLIRVPEEREERPARIWALEATGVISHQGAVISLAGSGKMEAARPDTCGKWLDRAASTLRGGVRG